MTVLPIALLAILNCGEAKQPTPYVTPQGLALSPDGKWMLHVEESGVRLLKVDDRRAPVCVDGVELPGHGSDGAFLVAGEELCAVAVDGLGLSVYAAGGGKLQLLRRLDISDDNVRGPESLLLRRSTCFLACRLGGLAVVDVSNPREPALVSKCRTANFARKVAVSANHAYVADSRGLTVMDVSNLRRPKQVAFLRSPDIATDITLKGDLAVLGCGKNWMLFLDVSDPARPKEVGRFRGRIVWYGSFFFDSVIEGRTLHVGFGEGGYLRLDIAEPPRPKWVSEYHPWRNPGTKAPVMAGVFTRAIVVDRDLAYLGDKGSIEVVDISHPSDVKHVSRVKTEPPKDGK